ncbi:MAG: hypothetical protein IKG72_13120 [Bacillus sp. (in: Bacteria)]|nr:hypothetical protein [Parasporobacterium sp.]MBR3381024.1 hypothetical protein [Bacillus sp. (in: firmicutes)]
MNVEEMIASIDAKAARDIVRKVAAEKAARDHDVELIAKIQDMTPAHSKFTQSYMACLRQGDANLRPE